MEMALKSWSRVSESRYDLCEGKSKIPTVHLAVSEMRQSGIPTRFLNAISAKHVIPFFKIWRFPKMEVPLNHPFIDGFSMK